jgi:hypothetical protein
MDVTSRTIKDQKKIPNAILDASLVVAIETFDDLGISSVSGVNASRKSEKISETKNRLNQETPCHIGPNGVIQSSLDHPTRKRSRKNKRNPRKKFRRLKIAPRIKAKSAATTSAAGIIRLIIM